MSLQPVIAWTPGPDADMSLPGAKYRIWWRLGSQSYDQQTRSVDIPVPCPNWYRMTQLTWWQTNFVRMTAVDPSNNESQPSNEASVFVSGGLILK